MGKKTGAVKKKAEFVDEEHTLHRIDNPDFLEMKAMEKAWSTSKVREEEIELLVVHDLLQCQELLGWSLPGEHRVLGCPPSKMILFVHFVRAGLCLPMSDFLRRFLDYYRISLHHLTPNGVLQLSSFVHVCETFVGIPPSLLLFRHYFRFKLSNSSSSPVLGGCVIQFRQGRKSDFFEYKLVDSCGDWHEHWFYVANPPPGLLIFLPLPSLIPTGMGKNSLLLS